MARRQENPPQDNRLWTTIALIGVYFLIEKFGKKNQSAMTGYDAELSAEEAPVKLGETVSADSYRLIADKRPGMVYVPVAGNLGQRLKFRVPCNGLFTRNVTSQPEGVFAEIAPSQR